MRNETRPNQTRISRDSSDMTLTPEMTTSDISIAKITPSPSSQIIESPHLNFHTIGTYLPIRIKLNDPVCSYPHYEHKNIISSELLNAIKYSTTKTFNRIFRLTIKPNCGLDFIKSFVESMILHESSFSTTTTILTWQELLQEFSPDCGHLGSFIQFGDSSMSVCSWGHTHGSKRGGVCNTNLHTDVHIHEHKLFQLLELSTHRSDQPIGAINNSRPFMSEKVRTLMNEHEKKDISGISLG